MQGVVLFLHIYVRKFSNLIRNDKIFRAKIYIILVGGHTGRGGAPVEVLLC